MRDNVKLLAIVASCCFSFQVAQEQSCAQDIRVNLSLLEHHIDTVDSHVPYLQIKYVNNSDKSYYFPGLVSFKDTNPVFSSGVFVCGAGSERNSKATIDYYEFCKDILSGRKMFNGTHYYMPLDYCELNTNTWELLTEEAFSGKEYEEDIINYYLNIVACYDAGLNSEHLCNEDDFFYTKHQLRCPIKLRHNPNFVFLKGKESLNQMVSLKSFMETGIVITFCLKSNKPPQMVKTGPGDTGAFDLPHKLQNYQLYNGVIECAPITLFF